MAKRVSHTKESLQAKRQCGVVPQNINLDNELTVRENLNLHGKLFRMARKERARRIGEILEYVELAEQDRQPCKIPFRRASKEES